MNFITGSFTTAILIFLFVLDMIEMGGGAGFLRILLINVISNISHCCCVVAPIHLGCQLHLREERKGKRKGIDLLI